MDKDIYSLFLDTDKPEEKKDKDQVVNTDTITVSFPAWGGSTTLVYNKETKILDVSTRWHKAKYDFNVGSGEISTDNEKPVPVTLDEIIEKTKLDRNHETVAFLKRHGVDVVFKSDSVKEPEEDLGKNADQAYSALKSIFKDKKERGNRLEYLDDVLHYAQSWPKEEHEKLIRGLVYSFPQIIGEYIIKDPENVFLVNSRTIGLLDASQLRQFMDLVIKNAKDVIDNPPKLTEYVNKYKKVADILSSYGYKDLETELDDLWNKNVLPDDNESDQRDNTGNALNYMMNNLEKLSTEKLGKYLVSHYSEIEKDERAFMIFRTILGYKPGVIKYLNPYDQKIEFQKEALGVDPSVVKYIYMPSFELAKEVIKKDPKLIKDILEPEDWRKFHSSAISKADDGWMGPNSVIKGTTPVPLSDSEVNTLRNEAISADPQTMLLLPNPTEYEIDKAFRAMTSYTDVIDMYKNIKSRGIKITPYVDHKIEQYLDI